MTTTEHFDTQALLDAFREYNLTAEDVARQADAEEQIAFREAQSSLADELIETSRQLDRITLQTSPQNGGNMEALNALNRMAHFAGNLAANMQG